MRKISIILAVIGAFIVFGSAGYDDCMTELQTYVNFGHTVKMILFGFLLMMPAVIGGMNGEE